MGIPSAVPGAASSTTPHYLAACCMHGLRKVPVEVLTLALPQGVNSLSKNKGPIDTKNPTEWPGEVTVSLTRQARCALVCTLRDLTNVKNDVRTVTLGFNLIIFIIIIMINIAN